MRQIYWIVIILLAGAIGAGVVYYARQPAPDVGPIVFHHQKPQSQNEATLSGWKTYTNAHYGFELSFPPSWSNMQVKDNGLGFYLPMASSSPYAGQYALVCEIVTYQKQEWDSFFQTGGAYPDLSLGEKNGMVFAYKCNPADTGFAGFEDYSASVKGGKNNLPALAGPDQEFKDLVIPTFKFVAINDMTPWKVYKNDKFGIEFKYPPDFNYQEANNTVGLNVRFYNPFNNYGFGFEINVPAVTHKGYDLSEEDKTIDGLFIPEQIFTDSKTKTKTFVIIQFRKGANIIEFVDNLYQMPQTDFENIVVTFKFTN